MGCGLEWMRGWHKVDAVYAAAEWLAQEGESGVGKLALIRAVHEGRNPARRFQVLDAADAAHSDWLPPVREELLDGGGDLEIRHVNRLKTRRQRALSAALEEALTAGKQRSTCVAVTLSA